MAGTSTLTLADESLPLTLNDSLNDRQRLFVDYYCMSLNATHAAQMAGYTGPEHSLASYGSQLLRNLKVAHEITNRLTEHAMSSAEILARLTDIARADLTLAVDNSGDIDIKQIKRAGKGHWVKKYKKRTYTRMDQDGNEQVVTETELELHDPVEALKYMGKFHGLVYNRLKIEIDWESQAIASIQAGHLNYDSLVAAFDRQQATKLFLAAKVPIPGNDTIEEAQYSEIETADDDDPASDPTTAAPVQHDDDTPGSE